MYPAGMWSPSSQVSDSCRTEYNNWHSNTSSSNRTPPTVTQDLRRKDCHFPAILAWSVDTCVLMRSPREGLEQSRPAPSMKTEQFYSSKGNGARILNRCLGTRTAAC